MKLFQKKKNNKGFSLVELIVVVAIMAVLLGVLVPTLVRHVETSKHQKDVSAVAELRNAFEIALANEKYANIEATLVLDGATITIEPATAATTGAFVDGYLSEVIHNLEGSDGTKFEFTYKSKIANDATNTHTTITIKNEKVTAKIESTKYGAEDVNAK